MNKELPSRMMDKLEKVKRNSIDFLKSIGVEDMEFTCDNCLHKQYCEYAYDPYNTKGDCLAEK